ncbi:MAG: GAF domain-containing protein [Coleofasciculus sp. C3-bin4]|nr:GAF domain-containing protein [Coleofasciculus sp. C3-bin4]
MALSKSETLLNALLACSPIGVAFLDRDLRYIHANEALASINGLPLSEHLGRTLWDVLPEWAPQLASIFQQVMHTKEPLLNQQVSGETNPPGILRHCLVSYYPVCLSDGQVLGVGVTSLDITELKRVEQALRESESRFRSVFESNMIAMGFYHINGDVPVANDALLKLLGYTREEFLAQGLHWPSFCPPEYAHLDERASQEASEFGFCTPYEKEYIRKDGSRVPILGGGGRFEGTSDSGVFFALDLTERKRAEQAQQYLAEASRVLSSSLDYHTTLASIAQLSVPQLADWCTVHLVEEDGSVQAIATAHVNPAKVVWAEEINQKYPFDPNEARGVAQVLRTGQSELYPEIPDHLLVEAARDAEHLQILREVGFRSVMIVPLLANSRTLGTISFVSAESGRRYDQADLVLAEELARRAALAVDNARLYWQAQQARQKAEQAATRTALLQAVTAAFSEALTPAQVASVVVNQGIAALGSGAGFVGLLVEDDTSLEIVESVGLPQELIDSWRCFPVTAEVPVAETVRTGQPIFLESVEAFVTQYPLLAHVPAVTGNKAFASIPLTAEGRMLGGMSFSFANAMQFGEEDRGFILTLGQQCAQAIARARLYEAEQRARAVSEAARSAAEAANRIKDEFLAVLSHELRSPLNPILGWTKLLRSRKFDEKATDRALETIERNAKLQTQLIEDLLDVSRILRGKLVLNVCPVNLVTTIEAALETVRLAAQAKEIQIQTLLAPNVGLVSGDSNRLQQVVWNLLSNAVKFTPAGGRVEVRLEKVGEGLQVEGSTTKVQPSTQYAQIQVSDTGKGITPEFLPHVFEYFRQENSTTTRQFGGLGLGLAIVRYLTELHGGSVLAESPGEGLGATFTVRLPLRVADAEATQDEAQPDCSANLSGLRVLVVDDEADIRELVAFILEQSGAEVTVTASAEEALIALNQSVPDVLLSDIGMPEVDGYMLMRQVRALSPERGGRLPAIAFTAYAGEYNQQQALAAGFQLHISKPVEPEKLVSAIASLVVHPMDFE